jgi:GntR family transcriptional regulator
MAKYERIADDLRRMITTGELPAGDRLPSETELTAQYRVSLPTLRQALSVLRAEGLIEARHGIGTYVRTPKQRVKRTPQRYHEEKKRVHLPEEQRQRQGAVEDDTGLSFDDIEFSAEFDTEPASDTLAAAFEVPVGTPLLCRTYSARSTHEDKPLHLIHSYLVRDVAAQNPDLLDAANETPTPWPGGTQHQLSTIGIEIATIVEHVTARPPTTAETELLEMSDGTSLICIRKVSTDTKGKTVEVSDIFLPGDRTELVYTTKLEPWS